MNTAIAAKPALIKSLLDTQTAVADFFSSLSPDEIRQRVAAAWTPAEHLDHLNTAVSAVARGFAISRWLLLLRFGWRHQPSRTFEQLRDDYRARLAAGGRARGGFVPAPRDLSAVEASSRLQELLERWQRVNTRLLTALENWSERDLERVQMPHPLLGKISAREMVFFTIYHGQHHIAAARTRLARFSATSG